MPAVFEKIFQSDRSQMVTIIEKKMITEGSNVE